PAGGTSAAQGGGAAAPALAARAPLHADFLLLQGDEAARADRRRLAARSRPADFRRAAQRARHRVRHAAPRTHRRAGAPGQDHHVHLARAGGHRESLLAGDHAVPGADRRQRRSGPLARPDALAVAGADFPPARQTGGCGSVGTGNCQRDAGGVMGCLGLPVRHFFGRFFDNEIVSQHGDMRTNVVQAIGLVATPGIFVPFYMLPQRARFHHPFDHNWVLLSDYYFFVMFSMVVMGFVMVFEWDALFPDRKDYLILTPLPLSGGTIFAGKTLALLLFLSLFAVDANLFCTLLAPLVTGGEGTPATVLWRLIAVHATAIVAAGAFVALSLASVQGVLINLLTGRGFRRVSPWVQMALMGGLIVVLFLTPLTCIGIRPLVESHSPLLRWFPPFWFLGLYMDMLAGQPGGPVFHELAGLARQGLGFSAAAFALTYLAGYRRHARRVMQSVEGTEGGPGWLRTAFERIVNRWLLPHPLERATFHFISCTILRNAKQRLFLATYGGIAVALALPAVIRIGTQPGAPILSFHAAGLLSVPLTLSFFAVSGLRVAFNFPAELRANWIFQ